MMIKAPAGAVHARRQIFAIIAVIKRAWNVGVTVRARASERFFAERTLSCRVACIPLNIANGNGILDTGSGCKRKLELFFKTRPLGLESARKRERVRRLLLTSSRVQLFTFAVITGLRMWNIKATGGMRERRDTMRQHKTFNNT